MDYPFVSNRYSHCIAYETHEIIYFFQCGFFLHAEVWLFRGVNKAPKIIIYTDGCALGNPGPGGYGAVLMFGAHRKELYEGFERTTNNRMELLAVIRALQAIKEPGIPIAIYSDSKYVCNAITEGWLFNWHRKGWQKVKNPDLWQTFLPLYQRLKPTFHWVKGHSGVPENERCDELANMGAALPKKQKDWGYEGQNNGPGLL